jgi:hypothetical protein
MIYFMISSIRLWVQSKKRIKLVVNVKKIMEKIIDIGRKDVLFAM